MKNLIFINGTMGVGKTTTSHDLKKLLPKSVFLDGDWCWDMSPFVVTNETKKMVEDNIVYLLNNFIACTEYENIIFCWVMHRQDIIDSILSRLNCENIKLYKFSIVCSEEALKVRINMDIEKGIRIAESIKHSLEGLNNYRQMDTIKIDTTDIQSYQAANRIKDYIGGKQDAV